jgi:hypothetical protein
MSQTIGEKFLITNKPSLQLIMSSLMESRDNWGDALPVPFETDRPLESGGSLESQIVINSVSRDRFLREVVFAGSYLSKIGPGVKIAGSLILDNSRSSYLWFISDSGLKVYNNDTLVFPQLSWDEQHTVKRT